MTDQTPQDALHGQTLKMIVNSLVAHYGWSELGERIDIRCFTSDPSLSSSLKFLRKTPWARKKVEDLYVAMYQEKMAARRAADRMAEIVHRWIEDGWQKGDVTVVDQLHSSDFIDHDSAGRDPGNEGFKQGIADLYAAFPDLRAQVRDLVIDTNTGTVAVRWSATGTHQGDYLGSRPSGRPITFKGIEIVRIRDDRIVERWGEWDGIDLLVQLGRVSM